MTLLHLVGHDATEYGDDALALARAIGVGADVERLVVHVLPLGGPTYEVSESWIAAQPDAVHEHLERVRSSLRADERVEFVFAGSPARGLHDRADEHGADLIVVGAHKRHPRKLRLGTVAGRLLSGGPCAIAHAPAGYAAAEHTLARIVVGYDASPESEEALREAAALAAGAGALVDVVYADDPASRMVGYPSAVIVLPAENHEAEQAAKQVVDDGLASVPEALRGIGVVRAGTAGVAIETFAAEQGADLVVVGSREYGPVLRALVGSTGSHVLHHTDGPVLVMPRGAHATMPAAPRGLPLT